MRQSILTRAKEIANGLYPHQIEGIAFLLSRRRALLANYMDLGKTRQSVLAMVEAERTGPYLVICPASVKRNWEREILYVLLKVDTAIVGPTDATEEADKNPERRRVVGKLATARRKLAFAKCRHTIKFVKNAIEQGEKVILFSTFLNTIERFYKHFGTQAVVVSGEVPTGERQTRVDQFQNDANVRLFIANMHVAGVGLNLTAGRQVVFNDLDWVPAKASLMSAFVEGTLLMPDENSPLQGDVLSELKL